MREINLLVLFIPIYFLISLIKFKQIKYFAFLLASFFYFSIITENYLYNSLLFATVFATIYSLHLFKKFFTNQLRLKAGIYLIIGIFILVKYFQIYEYKNENYFILNKTPLGFTAACIYIISILNNFRNRVLISKSNETFDPIKSIFMSINGMTSLAGPFLQFKDESEIVYSRNLNKLIIYYVILLRGLSKLSMSTLLMYLIDFPISIQNTVRFHSLIVLIYSTMFLYFSFSGLSDLIKGSMGLFGFKIPDNFKFPFISQSPSDFWQSWHITLGDFFKQNFSSNIHLFFYKKKLFTNISSLISTIFVFFLIAIWHEISYKIMLWAILNSIAVYFYKKTNFKVINILITNIFILLINGLFLSKDIYNYFYIVSDIFNFSKRIDLVDVVLVSTLFVTLFFIYRSEKYIIDKLKFEASLKADYLKLLALSVMHLFIILSVGFSKTTNLYLGY